MIGAVLAFISSAVAAYLIGSFPTSYILARVLKGIDIRQVGSGNAGATNVLRSVGKLPAAITLIFDALKGVIAVTLLVGASYPFLEETLDYNFYRAFLGLAAVSGHIWSIFLKFRGGKGIATTLGVSAVLAPVGLALSILVWAGVFRLKGYVSLASLALLITFPAFTSLSGSDFYTILYSVCICLIGTYKHKDNIKRLLKGEESKTILFKPR